MLAAIKRPCLSVFVDFRISSVTSAECKLTSAPTRGRPSESLTVPEMVPKGVAASATLQGSSRSVMASRGQFTTCFMNLSSFGDYDIDRQGYYAVWNELFTNAT